MASTLRSMSSVICWNTTPMRPSARTGATRMFWPHTRTSPASALKSPVSNWNSVLLPAPLGPSKATNSPARTSRSTPFKAGRAP